MRFMYYSFLNAYHREPSTFEDLFDGIEALGAMHELDGLKWRKT